MSRIERVLLLLLGLVMVVAIFAGAWTLALLHPAVRDILGALEGAR